MSTVAMLRALRPKQWIKNGLVVIPVVFAKGLQQPGLLLNALLAFVAFSCAASTVYVVNDWFDRETDKLHPKKSKRPFAAGELYGGHAIAMIIVLLLGMVAASLRLDFAVAKLLVAYLLWQLLYTWWLKHQVVVDVLSLAAGFLFRVAVGAAAVGVAMSNWLYLCTLLGATMVGAAKRRHEVESLGEGAKAHRATLQHYNAHVLEQYVNISAAAFIVCYALYTVDDRTVAHIGNERLRYTVPPVLYLTYRYLYLVYARNEGGSPESMLLEDWGLRIGTLVFGTIALAALYW